MCQHNKKGKIFCVTEQCSHSLSYGCIDCIKKYHKIGLRENLIQEEQLLGMMKVYQVPNCIKEERKRTIYNVYQTLNRIKNQIYDHIDHYFTEILSKIKYPFLYHESILEVYRMIRDKNYHKMDHEKLVRFYKTSKFIKNQDFLDKQVKYYEQYVRQTDESMKLLTSQLNSIESIFNFHISKETQTLHQDILVELASFAYKQAEQPTKIDSNSLRVDTKEQKSQNASSNSLKFEIGKQKLQFLTPIKPDKSFDLSFEKSPSNLSSDEPQGKAHRSNLQNVLFPELTEDSKLTKVQKVKDSSIIITKQANEGISRTKNGQTKLNVSLSQNQSLNNESNSLLFRQYPYNQSNTDSIFIKISQVSSPNINLQSSLNEKFINKSETKSTIQQKTSQQLQRSNQKKDRVNEKEQSVKKRLSELIEKKDQKKIEKVNTKEHADESSILPIKSNKKNHQIQDLTELIISKTKIEPKPSYFLNPTNKRKVSRHQSQLNDSLGKEVFDFAREEKPKMITRSIKKEIPLVDTSNSVKSEPVPKNNSFLKTQIEALSQKDKDLQMAAIFLSGINQPLTQNKIYFLQKYIQKYDGNITAVEYLAFLYLEKGNFKQCLNLSNKYLQKLKDCKADEKTKMNLIINKSAALNNLGRYSQTIKMLEECLKIGENDKVYKNIADAYFNINVLDKAIYHYEKAIKFNCLFDEAYFNVAVILYRQGSYFNAKMNIEKALRINKSEQSYLELKVHIEERISMNNKDV